MRSSIPEVTTVLDCVLVMNLCPVALVNDYHTHLIAAYLAVKGTGRLTGPGEYFAQPAKWIDTVAIIRDELQVIQNKKKAAKAGR